MTVAGALFALAALSATLCVVGVLVERRRFRNALLGGTATVLLLMAVFAQLLRLDIGVIEPVRWWSRRC
ncbi:hypothetical protein [Pseudonocardia sp. HH130629-09]|uniref:hypothetical protein n=1 Tax=Pseudonocardia sp. HH130629-09 TaxID=1641402 RepID=UPI0006CB1D7D|nr:hypothetical protein [Pseudonocardia sp. HH130629-09]ALE85751.1 hypothetical protein XF36_23530 [Pseudonocardia sp. HH130629-09]